jgi:Coenzyme PQQ synthesis protein D (PqqD)
MTWHLSPSVLISEVQSEAVLLNTTTGNCFVLDSLGLAICKLLEAECELPEIIEYLRQQFPDSASQIPQDVEEFMNSMVEAGLIQTGLC